MKQFISVLLLAWVLILSPAPALGQTDSTASAPVSLTLDSTMQVEFFSPYLVTFPPINMTAGPAYFESTTSPPALLATVTGYTGGWDVTYRCDGLYHTTQPSYAITNLTIDATGTIFKMSPDSNTPAFQGGNGQPLPGGATIIHANGPCRGMFIYNPGANNMKVRVNVTDDVIAGDYEGQLNVTISANP